MWSKAVSRLRINALANLLIDGGKRFVRVHGPPPAAATHGPVLETQSVFCPVSVNQ